MCVCVCVCVRACVRACVVCVWVRGGYGVGRQADSCGERERKKGGGGGGGGREEKTDRHLISRQDQER